jgi:tetratricopeptide (TPR) repeat protein
VSGLLLFRFCFSGSVLADSLDTGNFAGAQSHYHEALNIKADNLRALFQSADVELRKGKPREAEAHLRQALSIAPQEPAVYRAWGRYLTSQRKYPEAEKSFQKAVDLSHHEAGPEMDLGDFYFFGPHRVKDAVDTYRTVVAANPQHAGAHFALGVALISLGKSTEAEAELQQASHLAPTLPFPSESLGELYLHRQQYDKALEAFGQAVKIAPNFVPAHVGLGDAFWGKKDAANATKEYLKAAQLAPAEASLQIKLGMLDESSGKPQEAEQAYLTAVRLNPRAAVAYNNLAWMAVESKTRLDDAQKWAQTAVGLDSKVPAFQVTLAWVYRARGEVGKATTVLERSAVTYPQSPEVLYHLGIVYSETGKKSLAVTYLAKALAVEKDPREADDIRKRLNDLKPASTAQAAQHP